MALGSPWLDALERGPGAPPELFVCWRSDCDNIVFPSESAQIAGADNRSLPGLGHVALAFDPRVVEKTLSLTMPPPP